MKIKEGQSSHRYSTTGFWKMWINRHNGDSFNPLKRTGDKHVIRSESINSELLIALAK